MKLTKILESVNWKQLRETSDRTGLHCALKIFQLHIKSNAYDKNLNI